MVDPTRPDPTEIVAAAVEKYAPLPPADEREDRALAPDPR